MQVDVLNPVALHYWAQGQAAPLRDQMIAGLQTFSLCLQLPLTMVLLTSSGLDLRNAVMDKEPHMHVGLFKFFIW